MESHQAEDLCLKSQGYKRNCYYVEIEGERCRQKYQEVELKRRGD